MYVVLYRVRLIAVVHVTCGDVCDGTVAAWSEHCATSRRRFERQSVARSSDIVYTRFNISSMAVSQSPL
jgi:hypothetical protein